MRRTKRVLCLWFPGWPIQRLRRARPELERLPLVLYPSQGRGAKLWVTARSHTAGRQGVAVGMPLAEARALAAGRSNTRFEMHDPRADRETLRKIAVWCQRFTPVVGVEEREPPDSLLLDITGCGPLFGGEDALARKVVSEFRRRRFWVTAAVADTIGAAWAVAHFLPSPSGRGAGGEGLLPLANTSQLPRGCSHPHPQPRSRRERGATTIVPPGKHAEALRPLPVESLRLPSQVLELLREFDIRCVGELLALPRAELPGHFGPEVVRRLHQALGNVPELLTPERTVEPVEASWTFEPPAGDRRMIDAVFDHLLEQTLARLPRHVGVQRLSCTLRTAAEPVSVLVNLLRPSASPRHLGELARLHLEHVRLPAEVSAMTVRADAVAPLEFRQEQIFEDDAGAERRRKFQVLIERLSSRLGETCVLQARPWPDVQPEFAWRGEPWLRSGPPLPPGEGLGVRGASRPTCLKPRPTAIAVTSLFPGGPPVRFEWRGQTRTVARYRGPERIETGWWRGPEIRRDYYLVETDDGERLWLFRSLCEESWFMQGTF